MGKIELHGAPNTRDLGGIPTRDGRALRPSLLLRSGELSRLTREDAETLRRVPLTTVVDFRTERERTLQPDTVIPGVTYEACPIIEQMQGGITREAEPSDIPPFFLGAMRAGMDAENKMTDLYTPLVESAYSVAHYRQFFELVLRQGDGALLYHCTAGKDRVGVGTMLLLTALGVERETILEDYLRTNEYVAAVTEWTVERVRQYTDDPAAVFAVRAFDAARERYLGAAWQSIDARYGSVEAFLEQALGVGAPERAALREKIGRAHV